MTSAPPARVPIRRITPETVERIAAGEVVERPASVVKEIHENAIDAGATAVTVRLTNGGLGSIEVADDGEGIPPEELELAVERHATSKLAPEGPVERIASLGFRGEALAAIATVARLRLLSRPPERELAEGISVVGGAPAGRFAAPRSPGTTVEVADLFFNTPARRKFLKSPASEQVEVVQAIERAYLARPTVTIRLESEGRELAVYPATSELTDAAALVLGVEFLKGSFPVRGALPQGRVFGALGRPPLAAASARGLYLAVNGRSVTSRARSQAVRAAFGDYLPRTRYPVGVLHFELAAADLDVNVHPTKREVRIAKEREVAEAVRVRVRESLIAVPAVADLTAARWAGPSRVASAPAAPPPSRSAGTPAEPMPLPRAPGRGQLRLDSASAPEEPPSVGGGARPRLVLLGCLQRLYWVAESEDGLVLIDQHAASERLLYDALLRDRALARQTLVEALLVRLTGAQRTALAAHAAEVAQAGFEVDAFGPEEYRVRALPVFQGRRAPVVALGELLVEVAEGGRPTVPNGLRERSAATLACLAALRAGDAVSVEEFSRVLDALGALPEAPPSCPHGRPILLGIPRTRLDRWFLRSGA